MKKILTAHKIAKIKGAKISLWTNSPKLRAAKIKGFTVVWNYMCVVVQGCPTFRLWRAALISSLAWRATMQYRPLSRRYLNVNLNNFDNL